MEALPRRRAYNEIQALTLETSKRVAEECRAKRRIVEKAQRSDAAFDQQINAATSAASFALTEVLHLLALPYAEHPDCRDEWRL